jgi:hypothetical protein
MTNKNNTLELKIQPRVVLHAPRPNDIKTRVQSRKVSTVILQDARQPIRNASRREITQVSHNAARREISREFLREISLHDLARPVFQAPSPINANLL